MAFLQERANTAKVAEQRANKLRDMLPIPHEMPQL
jgi:hypothetical protein